MVQAMQNTAVKETDPYLEKFGRFEREAKQPPWVFPLRKAGLARFAELGFPTLRHEDWRFTNVAPIAKIPFKLAGPGDARSITLEMVEQAGFHVGGAHRLVFVNGFFAAHLSALQALPAGITVISLAEALRTRPNEVEPHLAKYAKLQDHAFTALNTAFLRDGAFISIPKGKVVDEPIY